MFYLVFLVFPTVETCLQGVAVGDSHTVYCRSYGVLFVACYTVSARAYVETGL